jgi:hypothetical protein
MLMLPENMRILRFPNAAIMAVNQRCESSLDAEAHPTEVATVFDYLRKIVNRKVVAPWQIIFL